MYIDDNILEKIKNGSEYHFTVFEAEKPEVILGRSRKKEEDVILRTCEKDGVPILRRAGGGGTVLLSPGVIVISIAGKTYFPFYLKEHMNSINEIIIKVLERFDVKDLTVNGISDITIGDKKILGSSLYKKKNLVLYQGSLLFNPDMELIDRYLKHPDKEPDYRKGRPHRSFLTSLMKEGYDIDKDRLLLDISAELGNRNPWSSEAGFSSSGKT
jgi:lipoate-protein ligase A